jgi:RNA polymerase sigma-32 factor
MKSKKTAKKAKSPRRKKSKTVAVEKVQAIPTPVQAEVLLDEEDTTTSSAAVALPEVQDTLASYLAQVSKYPLLTRDQEQEIAQRYKEYGDPKDAEILITSNLRFVVKVAAEYAKFGAKLIDLIQEGNMGLIHAVKEFNPYRGVRLITYAVWWIRGYIQDYLMKQYSMVKIGTTQNQRRLFYRLEKEKEKIDREGGEATVKLLSARLGVPEKDVQMMEERLSGRDVSLDQKISDDSSSSLLDFESASVPPVDEVLEDRELTNLLREKIEELKPELNERERQLLQERLLEDEPKTLQDIGEEWGVTREAVRQMEARLLKKIKERFTSSL